MLSVTDLTVSNIVGVIIVGVIVTASVALCSALAHKTVADKYAGARLPPGDLGLPLIGNAFEVRSRLTLLLSSTLLWNEELQEYMLLVKTGDVPNFEYALVMKVTFAL